MSSHPLADLIPDIPFLTATEVGRITRRDPSSVVRAILARRLAGTKAGGRWLVARPDLIAYLESGRVAPDETVAPRSAAQRTRACAAAEAELKRMGM